MLASSANKKNAAERSLVRAHGGYASIEFAEQMFRQDITMKILEG
jgi:hypothetical protein